MNAGLMFINNIMVLTLGTFTLLVLVCLFVFYLAEILIKIFKKIILKELIDLKKLYYEKDRFKHKK